jgi:sulfur carrier protein ThiS
MQITLKSFIEEQAILKAIQAEGGILTEEQEWTEGQTADELLAELGLGNNNV